LFWDGNQKKWAVRQGNWKLVSPKEGVIELYNLKDDIGEKNNLAHKYPVKTTALKNKYHNWRNEMATPMGNKKKK
ncbi:MAG: N-acetylgalactosamine 6-sulfatase (GALNS), partial [Bacteroidota bacterium]